MFTLHTILLILHLINISQGYETCEYYPQYPQSNFSLKISSCDYCCSAITPISSAQACCYRGKWWILILFLILFVIFIIVLTLIIIKRINRQKRVICDPSTNNTAKSYEKISSTNVSVYQNSNDVLSTNNTVIQLQKTAADIPMPVLPAPILKIINA